MKRRVLMLCVLAAPWVGEVSLFAAASPEPSQTPLEKHRRVLLSEPVRAISPGPGRRPVVDTPSPRVRRSPREKSKATPSPTPSPVTAEQPASVEETPAPSARITAAEIVGYEEYAPAVRRVLDQSLGLTNQNLEYKYGSADPARGGMDCSGFVHYVLSQSGLANVPRDVRDQYMWVRQAGTFQAVAAHGGDSSELDGLQPGDLLFWAGAYQTGPDPDVSYTMIYLGREKGTNERLMVGAAEGRSYKGQARSGVSVFDFQIKARKASAEDSGPVFVGYARIPALE